MPWHSECASFLQRFRLRVLTRAKPRRPPPSLLLSLHDHLWQSDDDSVEYDGNAAGAAPMQPVNKASAFPAGGGANAGGPAPAAGGGGGGGGGGGKFAGGSSAKQSGGFGQSAPKYQQSFPTQPAGGPPPAGGKRVDTDAGAFDAV